VTLGANLAVAGEAQSGELSDELFYAFSHNSVSAFAYIILVCFRKLFYLNK